MKKGLIWILPGLTVLIADRVVKIITEGMYMNLIPGVIAIHSARNTGMALGLFQGNALMILAVGAILACVCVMILRKMHLAGLAPLSLSLMAGGAIGNAADRLIFGYVLDMFEFLFIDFYIFNVADVGVVCGAILCGYSLIFRPQDWREK
ncbi:MAG: signal peptidase II [Clostridia bacterium]|nr:signal peptidase II [Clostridia bacterium]